MTPEQYARSKKVVRLTRLEAGVYDVSLTADGHHEGNSVFRDARSASAFAKKIAREEGASIVQVGFRKR